MTNSWQRNDCLTQLGNRKSNELCLDATMLKQLVCLDEENMSCNPFLLSVISGFFCKLVVRQLCSCGNNALLIIFVLSFM